jgi:cation:H+ antiporter
VLTSMFYLVIGLVFVIKGADFLVNGASTIARSFRISEFVIGLTIVSFGTSLPELIIALVSGENGKPDMIVGNVVGSNIANILLVLGVAAIIRALPATNNTVWREIPFTLVASIVAVLLLNNIGIGSGEALALDKRDGIILLILFLVFMGYAANIIRQQNKTDLGWLEIPEGHSKLRSCLEIVAGIVGLYFGGEMSVMKGAVPIAEAWGLSDAMIGLTIIAIGTSLPELATSAVAAYKNNVDIAVGNVVGSNIFNIFIVLGISSVVKPIPFDTVLNTDLYIMLCATILLFVFMFIGHPKRTIKRHEGVIFVCLYGAYLTYIIQR